jgi:hypothetical protein
MSGTNRTPREINRQTSKASWRSTKYSPYLQSHAGWLKIRNRDYSQWAGREELFERERETHPDFDVWDGCAMACEIVWS